MSTLHDQAKAEARARRWKFAESGQMWSHQGDAHDDGYTAGFLAGYEAASRPREVSTVDQLDALPVGSAVLSEYGAVWERESDGLWIETGQTWRLKPTGIALPARVLHNPEEDR